ncbi:MAG: hypothetical protein R2800_04440 [Flavipsychrobacter sp.]
MKQIPLIAVFSMFSILSLSQEVDLNARYVFFFHSKILEDMGAEAYSSQYGTYEFDSIVTAFKEQGYITYADVRPKNADQEHYAMKTLAQIDSLKNLGISSDHISVVGTSKGALIAMLTSTMNMDKNVKYILLGMCNTMTTNYFNIRLHGKVLSIYEQTDVVGKSCIPIKEKSKDITAFKEVKLETGLGHGFVFKPLSEWLLPTFEWIDG